MASVAMPQDLLDFTTTDALEEKKKLQKHFARFDILFFLICTLVGVDTIGAAASQGAQAFSWLIFLAAVFFVPYALLTAELGSAFPEEGGPYVWTRLAFGRGVAAVNALIYWISNPIWVGGLLSITALTAFEEFYNGGRVLPGPKLLGSATVFEVLFVLGFFTLSVVIYAFKHGVHGVAAGGFKPSYFAFIGLVPILFFNYVGFELPSAAGEEMKDPQKDVPFTVFRSAVGTILLYGGPILAILLVLPAKAVMGLSGFLDAIKIVFTIYGGHVSASGTFFLTGFGSFLGHLMAIAFILALISSGTTWVMGADRAQAMAALDGVVPRILGIFSSRFGTPIAVNLLSGVISSVVMVLAFTLTKGNAQKYFQVVLGLAISTTTISYIAIFPALIKLRYSHPHVDRPYRVPGGNVGAWFVGLLCTFWALLATAALLYPGVGINWFGHTGDPNASLPANFTRYQFEVSQVIPLIVFFLAGVLFYMAGSATRRHRVQVPIAVEMGVAPPDRPPSAGPPPTSPAG